MKQTEPEEKIEKQHGFELRTKSGFPLDAVVSALQKAIRRGTEERALYFMHEMVESGFIKYFWRRITIIALEDIGLADTQAIVLVNTLCQSNERVNRKFYQDTYCPGMAVLYLCRAPKSREIDYALDYVETKRKTGQLKLEPNSLDLDCHTEAGRETLKNKAKEEGKNYEDLVNEKFYYEGILTNNPVSIGNDFWKKKVWEMRKLNRKYDIKSEAVQKQ